MFFGLNPETAKEVVMISYGIMLGFLGNITFRANNKIDIKPFWVRLLNGALADALYIFLMIMFPKILKLDVAIMFIIFGIGFLIEPLSELAIVKMPTILDRLIDRYFPPNKRDGDNNGD
ncbi:MAG: hypothetical protein HXM47_04495 [Pseudoleptotrichia goodfellowii]|nr:hypothetical protein [Pseudoleptotrichia goodfellowii]